MRTSINEKRPWNTQGLTNTQNRLNLQPVILQPAHLCSDGISTFSKGPNPWPATHTKVSPPQTQVVWLDLTGPLDQSLSKSLPVEPVRVDGPDTAIPID
jgi:hypothetical protein